MLPTASPTFRKTSNFKAARSAMAARTSPEKVRCRVCAHSLRGAGDLVEVAADFSRIRRSTSNGGKQFIIDRGNGNNGANGSPCYGLPDKLSLSYVVSRKPLGKLGVFFLGHACLDYPAAVRRVVSFHGRVDDLLSVCGVLSLMGEKQGVKRNCF